MTNQEKLKIMTIEERVAKLEDELAKVKAALQEQAKAKKPRDEKK